MKREPIRAMVTGVGVGSVGLQIVKSLNLNRSDYFIIATNSFEIRLVPDSVDGFHQVVTSDDDLFLERIIGICNKEKIDIVFPGSEPELLKLSKYRELLMRENIQLASQPHSVITTLIDKKIAMETFSHLGISHPKTYLIEKKEDIDDVEEFPVVIKPVRGSGSKGVFIAQSNEELQGIFSYACINYGSLIVQDYVSPSEGEFTVGVITDPYSGGIHCSIAMKREISLGLSNALKIRNRNLDRIADEFLIISSGVSQGSFEHAIDLRLQIEEYARMLGIKGVANFQCRLKNGIPVVFEVNPRHSGTSFARAQCGINEADLLAKRIVHGEAIPKIEHYRLGELTREIEDRMHFYS